MPDKILSFKVKGSDKLEKVIQSLGNLDTQSILDEGAAVLFNRIRTRFLQQIDPSGDPWPVSQAALKREATGRGGGTLFDTGKLWRSIQLYAEDADTRAIGTDVFYGYFHQYGTIHLPARQFLGFNDEDELYMTDLVMTRIIEALGEAAA